MLLTDVVNDTVVDFVDVVATAADVMMNTAVAVIAISNVAFVYY